MAVKAQRHKLSRERDQRRALLKSMAESLILYESIVTTDAKARALKPYIEKLVTKAREDNQAQRRLLKTRLSTSSSLNKLFSEIAPRFQGRPGGYTRLTPAGWRRGDNAKMVRISFIENKTATGQAKEARRGVQDKAEQTASKQRPVTKNSTGTAKTKDASKTSGKTTTARSRR